ncbi:MAG: hypothetical protein JNK82_25840 [Myxococcaceae bacterium]|nr:hypothetical protein [Myxococcaceae bacterium]
MRLLGTVLLLAVSACTCNPPGGEDGGTAGGGRAGGGSTATAGGSAGGTSTAGGAGVAGGSGGGQGGGTAGGAAGGAPFFCSLCGDAGVCVDQSYCAAACPNSREACAGECCAAGARCCGIGMTCAAAGEACPALCPDGVSLCPDDEFCLGTTCVATCAPENRCGTNGCCGAGATCVAGLCALPDLVPLPAIDAGPVVVERRNIDPTWCDVARGCVGGAGERSLLHYKFRVANQGAAPANLTTLPGSGLLSAACTGETSTTWQAFARWELSGLGDGGVLAKGDGDLRCLSDQLLIDGGFTDAGQTFTCTMQGLSAGFAASQPAASGVCTTADVSNLDAGTYRLSLEVNPVGLLPEARLDNNRMSLDVRLPDTRCRGRVCGGTTCCPPNTACNAQGGCALPDLTIDEPLLASTIQFDDENFPANDCAIVEGCIGGGGLRRLMRFTTSTPNIGEADFFIGDPAQTPNATFAQCHGHYHYHQYAEYRLLGADGGEVVRGNKQAFCALDSDKYWPDAGPGKYNCQNQGVSVGWADTYGRYLDCQWIDITGVPAGNYTLEVEVNPNRYIAEKSYTNNVTRIPVGIPTTNAGGCVPTPEVCDNGLDEDCDNQPDDGCPPLTANATCATALELGNGGVYTGEISSANVPNVTPSCGGTGGDLFFKLHLLVPELVYASTYGSAIDTVLAVYSGTACGGETACSDDGCTLTQSHVNQVLPAGDYVFVVKAKNPADTGLVKLTFQRSTCTTAQQITAPGMYSGNTTTATNQFSLGCAGNGGVDNLWVFTSCPSSTMLTASTCGATWDTVVGVKQGSCRAPETGCDDDACGSAGRGSRVTMPIPTAGMWFIVVDGYNASSRGAYTLNVQY